jgi:ParB/RepB/Spo0J family partition protein
MAKSPPKITLSVSRDIPFDKLVLSQSNVRRVKAGVSLEELAEDIARRTLLQSLTVRPVLDASGAETGMYEVPAGGRRYRALELLVKQKRLARTAPVPCIIRTGGIAEEDSLAENVQRAPLHPLDQFRAFLALREKGQSEEDIAAAFFVSVAVVRQRLRLTSGLAYSVVETPRPGQAAILRDEGGTSTLLHLADTYACAEAWLQAHSYRDARIVAADAPEPRTFTYLQDPGHGWLIVDRTDLASAGMSAADFTVCSYVHGDTFALEEDVDMAKFLKRLDERGIDYRLREQHTNGDAHVRNWASNRSAAPSTQRGA